jgi:hypothetical protein
LFLYQTFDAVDGMQAYVLTRCLGDLILIQHGLDGGRDRVDLLESSLITVNLVGFI